jgi:hypothetical protein
MDAAYISTVAALAGSAIGALGSFTTTWVTQSSQARAAQRAQDRARREALYGEFISEASKLFVDAFEHELDDPAKLVRLFADITAAGELDPLFAFSNACRQELKLAPP